MSLARSPRQYLGVRAILPPDLQTATRAPTSSDRAYVKGTLWLDTDAATAYMWPGTGDWISLGSGTLGAIVTLTGDSGGAISPVGGNVDILGGAGITVVGTPGTLTISLTGGGLAFDSMVPDAGTDPVVPDATGSVTMAGTANQITTTGGLNSLTFSIPAAFIAPGSIVATTTVASTTTMTAGTGLTATTGNIAATAGNVTAGAAMSATTTVTAGTGITSTTGNIVATAGAVNAGTSMTATAGDITATLGHVIINGAARQLRVHGGAVTDFIGQAVLVNGTVTVANTNIAATDRVFVSRSNPNASTALGVLKVAITAATNFIITACDPTDASTETNDASTIDYFIVRQV